ncbi:putative The fantastic four family protein [Rosa chinensis]|uniref:Putative The fantastic four family protein n=1 Tax=Rosa chinensis TaxID=74649 RepID=A0A2P6QEM4_ROSCH|nr:protein FAF-like, chloroplastic [Rosa chinensis]PRQ32634.1 putative The fantastic four family protein [Rosa chinensis]
MPGCLSKSLHSSSHFMKNMEQEAKVTEKQGIVTILGSDCERNKAASLRRTLSADMSSKKWLAQQGFFSPMKKIASSKELSMSIADSNSSSSSDEDEDHFRNRKAQQQKMFHIWTPIDQDDQIKKTKKEMAEGKFDIWSSLVNQKDGAENEANKIPEAPYVHPLVKKQSSSLKGKSLEVCTESLGSETGSEGFGSYPSSETGDIEVAIKEEEQVAEIEQPPQQQQEDQEKQVNTQAVSHVEEFRVVKYNSAAAKKSAAVVVRSFPPPIPSLSGSDGASLRIKTHRDNGRVVLEAVSMPSPNNFRAQRQDGRLVLTFVSATPSSFEEFSENEEVVAEEQKEELEYEEKFVNFVESETEDEDDEEDEDREKEEEVEVERVVGKESGIKEIEIGMEEAPKMLTSRVTTVHRLALMMKKPIGLANRSQGWAANKFNQVVKYGRDEEEETMKPTPLAQSLPPRPGRVARLIPKSQAAATATPAAAASLNAYEYYWRTKPTAALNPLSQAASPPMKSKDQMANQQQQLLVLRGNKGDHMVPLSKGCKEPRRSLLFWEPYCIATS